MGCCVSTVVAFQDADGQLQHDFLEAKTGAGTSRRPKRARRRPYQEEDDAPPFESDRTHRSPAALANDKEHPLYRDVDRDDYVDDHDDYRDRDGHDFGTRAKDATKITTRERREEREQAERGPRSKNSQPDSGPVPDPQVRPENTSGTVEMKAEPPPEQGGPEVGLERSHAYGEVDAGQNAALSGLRHGSQDPDGEGFHRETAPVIDSALTHPHGTNAPEGGEAPSAAPAAAAGPAEEQGDAEDEISVATAEDGDHHGGDGNCGNRGDDRDDPDEPSAGGTGAGGRDSGEGGAHGAGSRSNGGGDGGGADGNNGGGTAAQAAPSDNNPASASRSLAASTDTVAPVNAQNSTQVTESQAVGFVEGAAASHSDTNDEISCDGDLQEAFAAIGSDTSSSPSSSSSTSATGQNELQQVPPPAGDSPLHGDGQGDDAHSTASGLTSYPYTLVSSVTASGLGHLESLPELLRGSAMHVLREGIKLQLNSYSIASEDLWKIQRMLASGLSRVESGGQVVGLLLRCQAHYAHGKIFADQRYPDADTDSCIEMYTKALEVLETAQHVSEVPVLYGCIQYDLAVALLYKATDERSRAEPVERAVSCLHHALRVNPLSAAPRLWRKLNSFLSEAYVVLSTCENAASDPRLCLHNAYRHAHSICLVRSVSKHPVQWAMNLHKMALIILNYLDMCSELSATQGKLRGKTQDEKTVASTLANHPHHNAFSYAKAIELLQRALSVQNLRPQNDATGKYKVLWCNMHMTIARGYLGRARVSRTARDAKAAERHLTRHALRVVTFISDPIQWSRARRLLAEAQELLSSIAPTARKATETVRSISTSDAFASSPTHVTRSQSTERTSKPSSSPPPRAIGPQASYTVQATHSVLPKEKKGSYAIPIVHENSGTVGGHVQTHSNST